MFSGNYSIDDVSFSAPNDTSWEEVATLPGVNGIERRVTYRQHSWQWDALPAEDHMRLNKLFLKQQYNNSPLTRLETDPYQTLVDPDENYGTIVYTNFKIISIEPKTRTLSEYQPVRVEFRVYVPITADMIWTGTS